LRGTGLFSGRPCAVRVEPATAGSGIVLHAGGSAIPAEAACRIATPRRTTLARDGTRVETVEHFLAAVGAAEYDDLDLIVEGGEIPIGDGSFQPFVNLLRVAGAMEMAGTRRTLVVEREIHVIAGEATYRIAPDEVLSVDVTLDYAQPVIGRQRCSVRLDQFAAEIAPARTFGFIGDIRRSQARGELRGAADGTGIAFDAERAVNTTLRWPDEPVRHKAGDLLGDLLLLGAPLRARVTARRPSHDGNFACVRAILDAARFLEA
jgi:UDP-3-O-acyl N-acetylglucosamine deacetylase